MARLRTWICRIATAGLLWSTQAYAASPADNLPMLSNLHSDGLRAQDTGKPIVILFSLPGCPFCHVIRQHYLMPLLRDRKIPEQPILREVDITSADPVKGFDNAVTSHQAVAKEFKVWIAPTVVFLDHKGRLLTEPIVGGDTAGMYGGYLDRAMEEAERKIAARQTNTTRGRP